VHLLGAGRPRDALSRLILGRGSMLRLICSPAYLFPGVSRPGHVFRQRAFHAPFQPRGRVQPGWVALSHGLFRTSPPTIFGAYPSRHRRPAVAFQTSAMHAPGRCRARLVHRPDVANLRRTRSNSRWARGSFVGSHTYFLARFRLVARPNGDRGSQKNCNGNAPETASRVIGFR
jgi:hypothetical protein